MPEPTPDLSILITNKKRGWSGETAYILELIRGFVKRDVPVCLATREGAELTDRVRALGAPVYELHFDPRSGGMKAKYADTRTIREIVQRHGVNILNTNASWDTWIATVALRRTRGVTRIRTKHNLKRIRRHMMNRWLYGRLIQKFIAPSRMVYAHLDESGMVDMADVRHIRLGIPLDPYVAVRTERESARAELARELNLAPDALGFVAVYVSRITDRKHPEDLVEAVKRLGPESGVRAVFVGGGESDKLEAAAAGVSNAHVLGHRTEPARYFAAADVFSLPSRNEPFGLAAVEAMAAGTPVVLPDAGGFQEIGDHERNGLLYDVAEPVDGLVAALDRLARDPILVRALGEFAGRDAVDRFDADSMVDHTLAYYRDVTPAGARAVTAS